MDYSAFCCIIPGELVIDILSMLPVKSLTKFKFVCKSWNSLTRDPDFISNHSKVSAAEARDKNINWVLLHRPAHGKPSLSVQSDNATSNVTVPVTLPFDMSGHHYRLSIVGTCDGIVCVYGCRSFSFWQKEGASKNLVPCSDLALFNPATREVKVIPMSPQWHAPYLGFGYDPKTNDYKIVTIKRLEEKTTEVYSLKSKSWKFVEVSHTPAILSTVSVHVNGLCYWWSSNHDQKLISFDMTNEEFGDIDLPGQAPDSAPYNHVKIVAINGYLCLIWPTVKVPYVFSLWVMVNKSWMKGKAIELPEDYYYYTPGMRRSSHLLAKYELLTVRRNGDIVLLNKWDCLLKLYDKSTRKVTPMQFGATSDVSNIVYCKETLFSLS